VAAGGGKYLTPPQDWKSITPAGGVLESLKNFWKSNTDVNGVVQINDANQ
jgi:hypothetical protein